jgi:AraC-like DNA-binding protein
MAAAEFVSNFYAMLGDERGECLYDALPGIHFFVKDLKGRYVRANAALGLAHGFSDTAAIIGRTDHDFIPRHLADHYVADDKSVFQGNSVWNRVELVLLHQGCPDWHVTAKVPLRSNSGRIVGLAGISRQLRAAAATIAPFTRLEPALDYIRQYYAQPISLRVLAAQCHLSSRQLQRSFQQIFQMSPTEYVREYRIGQAMMMLLHSDAKLTTVAIENGFTDHSHFSREFCRRYAMTPGAYRKKYRG